MRGAGNCGGSCFDDANQPQHNGESEDSKGTMRYTSGFIRMEREIFLKYFEGDGKLWATYTYLAMNINWDNSVSIYTKMGKDYTVEKSQFYTTYQELNHWLGFNFRTIKDHLLRLKNRGLINLILHKNCMCIVFLQSTCSGEYTTNEEYKNKEFNRVSKDTHVKTAQKSAKKSQGKSTAPTSEVDKIHSTISENAKNIPPVAGKGSGNAMTPEDLFRLWNELSGPFPKCRVLTDSRKKKLKIRLKENPDQMYWEKAIKNLSNADDWVKENTWCTFDWLIKNQENGDKAFSGNYNKKKKFTGVSDFGQNYDDIPY